LTLPEGSDILGMSYRGDKKDIKTFQNLMNDIYRMNSGELLPRNEKNFKKFKTLKEIKLTNTRMLVRPGKDGAPDEILVIFMKKEIKNVENNLKKKYD